MDYIEGCIQALSQLDAICTETLAGTGVEVVEVDEEEILGRKNGRHCAFSPEVF